MGDRSMMERSYGGCEAPLSPEHCGVWCREALRRCGFLTSRTELRLHCLSSSVAVETSPHFQPVFPFPSLFSTGTGRWVGSFY